MRRFIQLLLIISVFFGFISFSQAQEFPSKPIKIIVPFGPGGIADLTARPVAQKMSELMGQGVIVENRPGAGGIAAAEAVVKSEPDGYTLLLMSNANAISVGLFNKLPFDTLQDLTPISTLGYFDIAIIVSSQSPFNSMSDLLAFAKVNPGKLNLGSINIGSTQNLAAELFKTQTHLDMQVIPFNGTAAVITAVRGGQVDVATEILGPIVPQVNSKAVRILAVTGAKRSPFYPDIPTAKELGIKEFTASSWNALAAPAKTPQPIIMKLNNVVVTALKSPDVKARLSELYMDPQSSSPEDAKKFLSQEINRWSKIIQQANIAKQ